MPIKTTGQSEVRVNIIKGEYHTSIKLFQAHAQFDEEPIRENNIVLSANEWEVVKEIVDKALK